MTNRTFTHTYPPPTNIPGRLQSPKRGLILRGGLGKPKALLDAIPLFLVLIIFCLPRDCKILCTIVSPFLTQLGLLVMGGCITEWVSVSSVALCMRLAFLRGTILGSELASFCKAIHVIKEERPGNLRGDDFIHWGSMGVDGYTEQKFQTSR